MYILLFLRKLSLRILLMSSLIVLLWNTSYFILKAHPQPDISTREIASEIWSGIGIPLAITLHHTLRLWRRWWWLVICEVIISLVEIIVVTIYYTVSYVLAIIWEAHWRGTPTNTHEINVTLTSFLGSGVGLVMTTSISALFLFLLCDVLGHCRVNIKYLQQPYSFDTGLCHWELLFGRWVTRKRFSTDNVLIRCIRGGLAALAFVGIFCLAFYTAIWRPLQWRYRPGAKIFKLPVVDGLESTLGSMVDIESGGRNYEVGWPLRAALVLPKIPLVSNQYPTMNTNITVYEPTRSGHLNQLCNHTQTQHAVVGYCPIPLPRSDSEFLEVLLTINFSGTQGDFRLYFGFHPPTAPIEEILAVAEPIGISPGVNIHGWASVSVKEHFSDQKSAFFGIPKYRRLVTINLRAVSPDWLPSLPKDNDTSTVRVTIESPAILEIEQEYREGSMLSGLAVVGGIWTLVNGTFAAIFGRTLLLVLFGIKPLSIYGLIHYFRPGRGSLVDGDYALTPEERDRAVGIFREHLLDVDEAKENVNLLTAHSIDALPQFNRSHSDVGVQT